MIEYDDNSDELDDGKAHVEGWRECRVCHTMLPDACFAEHNGMRGHVCFECEEEIKGNFDVDTSEKKVDRGEDSYVPLDGLDMPNPYAHVQNKAVEFDYEKEAAAMLRRRELARRNLLPFISEFKAGYSVGWVHKDICKRLKKFGEAIERGENPRLMLFMPPRSGKSEIVSRNFPAWFLGRNPDKEIIACSYASSLANSFSRKVRDILRDPAYKNMFPLCELDKDNQAVEQWMTTAGGGYVSAGVGGSIVGKGAHCFPAGTKVKLADGSYENIEDIIVGKDVLTYDTKSGKITTNRVIARQAIYNDSGLFEVTTGSGKRVTATGNHPFYVPSLGWVRADELKEGYEVYVDKSSAEMSALREGDSRTPIGYEKAREEWEKNYSLLTSLLGGNTEKNTAELQDLWSTVVEQTGELLRAMQAEGLREIAEKDLSSMFSEFSAIAQRSKILFSELRECASFEANAGHSESELSAWISRQISSFISSDAANDSRARLAHVRGMLLAAESMCPPHRPHADAQRGDELDYDVQKLPHYTPQVSSDRVSKVVRLGEASDPVYDIQVEATSCFFAGDILVHNCLIIDDPVKGREEAKSEKTKESIRDWYTGSAYTRLAPGGGVLIIMQRWAEDDLAGWLLAEDQLNDDENTKENWEVVLYPAIAEQDETYRRKGEALHRERYDEKAFARIRRTVGERDWNALFQQNPLPDSGDYFKEEMFTMVGRSEYPSMDEMQVYAAWDLALGEKEANDFSVGFYIGVCPQKMIWILHVEKCKLDSKNLTDRFFELDDIYQPIMTGFEQGHIEKAIGPFLDEEMLRQGHYFSYEPLKVGRRDKQVRATTIRGMMQRGIVHWDRNSVSQLEAKSEMLKFPNGKHDDHVDSIAHIGLMIRDLVSKRPKKAEKKKSWRDEFVRRQLRTQSSNGGKSFMSS